MKTIAVPVAVFQVECEIASGRPFAMVERTILRSIEAGNVEFERLVEDLSLHPRMVAECLTALFEAGIIEFRHGTGAFSLTAMGIEALGDPEFIPSTLQCVRKPYWIVVERITGLAEVGWNVTFERTDELRDHGVTILQPSDIDPTPGRSTVRQLIERRGLRAGEWVRSVGRPEPVYLYNHSVQVDVRDGHLEQLHSAEWVRALTLTLRERGFDLAEPAPLDPDLPWIVVAPARVRAIWGAGEHAGFLEETLGQSSGYVFIHSAFLTGSRARQLAEPIAGALRRGVDVLLARGGAEETESADEEGVAVFKKLAYDARSAKGRFFFEPYPTGSHAKLLVRDGEQVCVGSFNWLSARPDSTRAELSVLVSSTDLAAAVCDVAADLFREGNVAWPAQALRTSARPGSSPGGADELTVRLVMDADNRQCLFSYIDQAQDRLVIASDKVTSKGDPFLREKLLRAARFLAARSRLAIRFSSIDGDRAPLLEGLANAGAVIVEDGANHVKALIRDELCALVTSFNLLSFGGRSGRRSSAFEVGLELRAASPARELFQTLFAPLY